MTPRTDRLALASAFGSTGIPQAAADGIAIAIFEVMQAMRLERAAADNVVLAICSGIGIPIPGKIIPPSNAREVPRWMRWTTPPYWLLLYLIGVGTGLAISLYFPHR